MLENDRTPRIIRTGNNFASILSESPTANPTINERKAVQTRKKIHQREGNWSDSSRVNSESFLAARKDRRNVDAEQLQDHPARILQPHSTRIRDASAAQLVPPSVNKLWPVSQEPQKKPSSRRTQTGVRRLGCGQCQSNCLPRKHTSPRELSLQIDCHCLCRPRAPSFSNDVPLLHVVSILYPGLRTNDTLDVTSSDRLKTSTWNGFFSALLLLLLAGTVFGVSLLVGMIIYQPVMIISTIIHHSDVSVLLPLSNSISESSWSNMTPFHNGNSSFEAPVSAVHLPILDDVTTTDSLQTTLAYLSSVNDDSPVTENSMATGHFTLKIRLQSLTSFSIEADLCYDGCVIYALARNPQTSSFDNSTEIHTSDFTVGTLRAILVGSLTNMDARPYKGLDSTTLEAKIQISRVQSTMPDSSITSAKRVPAYCQNGYINLTIVFKRPAIYTFSGVIFYPPIIFPPFLYPCLIKDQQNWL